jgi:parallel beta-helix repeat protein
MKSSRILVLILALAVLNSICVKTSTIQASSHNFTILDATGKRFQSSFVSIQQAIDEAENGSTIYVPSGLYNEHVIVNKTVRLVGMDISTTIIDGSNAGTVMQILADDVSVSNFTLQNSGWGWTRNGVYVYHSNNCRIESNYFLNNCHNVRINCSYNSIVSKNTIKGSGYGIRLINSVNCTAAENNVSGCIGGVHLENATNCVVKKNHFIQNDQGIRLYSPCTGNEIYGNVVLNNTYDGMIATMPGNTTFLDNLIFHNNFIDNKNPFILQTFTGIIWNGGYPLGGNYWARYNGTDLYCGRYQNETGSDGIGDLPYVINVYNQDRYPLVHPWSSESIHNINTGLGYVAVQEAIDANETVDRDTIFVEAGTYCENIVLNKTLSLIGENPRTTIIDGRNIGTVLTLNAANVGVNGFTIRNSGQKYPPYGNDCGIFFDHANMANVSNNIMANNRIGLYLFYSQECVLENNIVSSNSEDGVWLYYSGGNLLRENRIFNNSYNFGVFGSFFKDFDNTIDTSNVVDDKPIIYHVGRENEVLDNSMDAGVVYLINCNNITVRDLNMKQSGHGIFGFNITNSRIQNVTASENNYGIYLQESNDNVIENNSCLDNWAGFFLQGSTHNIIRGNIAENSEKGISLYDASNNSIIGNMILHNLYGIRLFSSDFNEILHSNLIENTMQADLITSYQNKWDNGFEGNFWSDYNGSDVVQDGIGDVAYAIDSDNFDSFPLMGTFSSFAVPYRDQLYEVSVISNSTILDFVFDTTNATMKLTVNGTDGTYGFCRISIPHALVMPEIQVMIDNNATELLYANYNVSDNGFSRWIYFIYEHSTHTVIIVPEFWSLVFALSVVFAAVSYFLTTTMAKRKQNQTFTK